MDGHQFDRLAQGVATGLTRRRTLGGLVASAVVLLSGQGQDGSAAKKRGKPVTAEGPCGNGSVKDNRCKHHSQCCTGVCDKAKGKKPYGRCRCKTVGQSCQEDRNCCTTAGQPMTCQDKVCVTTDPTPPPPSCGGNGATCTVYADCCEGFSCESGTCQPNICAHTCLAADNFCNVPPANQCCGGKNTCRCMTTNDGPFCFGGAGFGGCEGTTAQGKTVPHCETNADCEAVFGATSGVQCIAASTFPSGSSCCPGGTQSACILPCPVDA